MEESSVINISMKLAHKIIADIEKDKSVFSNEERDFIVNHAYKTSDMESTRELANRIASGEEPFYLIAKEYLPTNVNQDELTNESENSYLDSKKFTFRTSFGESCELMLNIEQYENTENIALQLLEFDGEVIEPFAIATTNFEKLPPYHAYIKNDSENTGILEFLIQNGLAEKLGSAKSSGFSSYPLVKFNEEALIESKAIGMDVYQSYVKEKLCQTKVTQNENTHEIEEDELEMGD